MPPLHCLKSNWRFLAFVCDKQGKLPETGSYSLSATSIDLTTVSANKGTVGYTCISSVCHKSIQEASILINVCFNFSVCFPLRHIARKFNVLTDRIFIEVLIT